MIRELPPDWAPAWPPAPQTRLARFIDRSLDRCPWDQIVLAALFALYVCVMGAVIVHLA